MSCVAIAFDIKSKPMGTYRREAKSNFDKKTIMQVFCLEELITITIKYNTEITKMLKECLICNTRKKCVMMSYCYNRLLL